MRTAIRSDAPSASASGTRIVVDDRDAAYGLRPVDQRVEHEHDQRDRRRHDHGPRDPLQPRPFVRAPGATAPHEVAHDTDHRIPVAATITTGVDETSGFAVDQHRREHHRRCVHERGRDSTRRGAERAVGEAEREVHADRGQQRRWRRLAPRPPRRATLLESPLRASSPAPNSAIAPTSAPSDHQRGERLGRSVPGDEDRGRTPRRPRPRAPPPDRR